VDYLFGRIKFDSTGPMTAEHSPTEFHDAGLDLHVERTHNFKSDTRGFFYNERDKVLCAALGYISNLDSIRDKYNTCSNNDVEVVAELYSRVDLEFVPELQGVFALVILDENTGKAYLLQGPYGYHLPLYYARIGNSCVFSTSLKQLLGRTRFDRELNRSAVSDLLYYKWFVPNAPTLIKGVSKLIPTQYLVIDCASGSVKTRAFRRNTQLTSQDAAKGALLESIRNEVSRIVSQLENKERFALTLSGGFDSNFLLHTLAGTTAASLTAFTIGGKETNEIPQARAILDNYSNTRHIAHQVGEDALERFPEIVWRLEGYVIERGMFLTYELARLVAENHHTSIFLGDCADQQLRAGSHYNRRSIVKSFLKTTFVGDVYRTFTKNRPSPDYSVTLDCIQKKGGIMLNSFGVQGLYPFLNEETDRLSQSLGELNVLKCFYKQEVMKTVGRQIAEQLEKQGGSTDIEYLFEARKNLVARIVNSESLNSVLRDVHAEPIGDRTAALVALRLVYIYLFKKLFVDGEYDETFESERFAIPLDAFT